MNAGSGIAVAVPTGTLRARLHPVLQLRSSGFAVDGLLPRPPREAAEALRAVLSARQDVASAQAVFRAEVFPALRAAFPALERARRNAIVRSSRLVAGGRALPEETAALCRDLGQGVWVSGWTAAVARLGWAVRSAEDAHRRAVREVFDQVRAAAVEPRVHRALAQSGPGFTERLFRPGGPLADAGRLRGKDRADLLTAHRYLRRFAARCETVSFFGPSCFATLDPALAAAVEYGEPGPERVSVDASAWLVRELAARCGPRGGAALVGRDPLWRLEPDALVRTVDGLRLPVDRNGVRLWEALDGGWLSLRELAGAAGLSAARLRELIGALGPALRRGPLVPSTERRALRALAGALPGTEPVEGLLDRLDRVAATSWPDREKVLADAAAALAAEGLPTDRQAGAHYADRSFWHEEQSGPYSERVRLGRPTVAGLTRAVGAVLEPLYLAALLTRVDARAAVRAAFGGRPVPLAAAAVAELADGRPRFGELRDALAALVRRTPAGRDGAVHLTGAQVAAVCAPFWSGLGAADLEPSAALPGFDLLAAGSSPGEALWVLGEVHDDSSSVLGGSSTRVHSQPEALYAEFCREVAGLVDPGAMAGVVSRRRSMHITPELPGLAVELSGVSGKPAEWVVPIAEVTVDSDGAAVEAGGGRRHLYPGDLSSTLHRALSLPCVVPVDLGGPGGSPRVLIDGVVVARAEWRLDAPESSGPGFPHWEAWQRLRAELRLPRRVFVRHEAEAKPFFVDLDDPVAVDDLARLGPGRLRVSECLPGPDELWWRPGEGSQVSELRVAVLIDHTGSTGGDA